MREKTLFAIRWTFGEILFQLLISRINIVETTTYTIPTYRRK